MAAAETALQPAWAALDVGEHKVPPTPPQRSRAADLALGPSPARTSPARAERLHRGTPGGSAPAAPASSAPHEGLAAACSYQSAPGMAQSGVAVSPFSAAQPSATAACGSASGASGWSPSPESRHCGGGAGDAAADAERCSGGFRTPPRTRSCSMAKRAGAGQEEAARAAGTAGSQRGSPLSSAAVAAGCGRAGSPGAAAAGGGAKPARPGAAGDWPAAPFLRRFSAAWVHVSMATAGVALRERQRRYADAADLLRLLLGAAPTQHGCTRLPRCTRVRAVPWCGGSVQSQMLLIHEQGSRVAGVAAE